MSAAGRKKLAIALLFAVAAGIAYYTHRVHESQLHAIAIILGDDTRPGLLSKNRQIAPIVAAQFRDYKSNSIMWSFGYHTSLYMAAFLGVLATLVLKIDSWPAGWDDAKRKDYAAALAAFSALMITVSTSGDFQGKWQSSRLAATRTAGVAFDLLEMEDGVPREVIAELKAIFLAQNLAVIGEGKKVDTKKAPATDTEKRTPP